MKKLILAVIIVNAMFSSALSQDNGVELNYGNAYTELTQMLKGEVPLSFKRAVFITENAFLDNSILYEDFEREIKRHVALVQLVANADGLQYDSKDRKQILYAASIYRVLKDTIIIEGGIKWGTMKKMPYVYDMDDFWGENDWTKMFVSKLIYDQSGNCHSLPALYKILADEVGAKAWLALAPNHTYIKQWSDKTGWYNTELTSGRFPFDKDIKWNSYIKTEAIADGIYMDTLSSKQTIAYVITDLVQGYVKKQGFGNVTLPLSWLDTALKYYPNYVNALILRAELLKKQYENKMETLGISDFKRTLDNQQSKEEFAEIEKSYLQIHELGYRRMPKQMYLNWLYRIQHDTTNMPFQIKSPQPFKKYGYNVIISTAGDGQNFEFFDQSDTVRIGTVELNIRTRRIITLTKRDNLQMPDEVISRMYDPAMGRWWAIDPLAERFYTESPYNFVHNNPIIFTDPDGRAPLTDFYNLQGNQVKHVEDGKNDKVLVLTTSKNGEKVDAAIAAGQTMSVPSNGVVSQMESVYNQTESTGLEHGFLVGETGVTSKTVQGSEGEVNSAAWSDARKDLNSKGDGQAYDVHSHPLGKDGSGNVIDVGLPSPSSTDMAPANNELNTKPSVVLGYEQVNTPPPSNQIGGSGTTTFQRSIGVYNSNGLINPSPIRFSDFSRAVNKINKQ